ncbi:MAG TPA: exodeoxyribonuclease V subunit beta [Alcanivoracaceae bacterium]|nr:exodeoxyribonuclease V subunit beta [Alcanivoracaceae bacterium]
MNTHNTPQLNPLAFPLYGSRLIEASAGTGKTFTLALLYVRLILGQNKAGNGFQRPLTPKEILVVTFTNIAAGELRDRIRARLVEAAAHFHHPSLQDGGFLDELREQYEESEWLDCALRLEMAAESMDEAAVSTIHSWCNRILVEHSFNTRGLFNRELVTDTSELFSEVVQDYWRSRYYALTTPMAKQLLNAIGSYDEFESHLLTLLNPNLEGVSLDTQPLALGPDALTEALTKEEERAAEITAKETALQQQWRDNWDEIVAELNELRPYLNGNTYRQTKNDDAFSQLLEQVQAWLNGNAEIPAEILKYRLGEFKFTKSAPREEQPLVVFKLTQELHLLREKEKEPIRAYAYAEASTWVAQEFQRRLTEHTQMRHDDLLTQLEQALNPDHAGEHALILAESLRKAFPVAMIDEFQDTDPIQYNIFNRIYRVEKDDPEGGIFMIGDPKQSIYSFRGADIDVYLAARQATAGRHYTLKKNFRSTAGVVKACNALFLHAEQHPQGAFQYQQDGHNPIPYVEVEAAGRDNRLFIQQQPATAMNFWYQEHPEDPSRPLSMADYRTAAAQSAASEVAQWLLQGQQGTTGFGKDSVETPLSPADIAILVRTGTEAEAMTQALAAHNIPSVYLSDRSNLLDTQEALDVLHWLRAVAEPSNENLLKAALGTATMALPMEHFITWQHDELAWEQEVVRFGELNTLWLRQGVLVMLQRLLDAYALPARLLHDNTHQGERRLTNLLHLAEWLQRAETKIDGQQALVRHLHEHLHKQEDENILRLESDAQRVKIITIHKSKGLEYPLVLLPFMSAYRHIDGKNKIVNIQVENKQYSDFNVTKAVQDIANAARIKEDLRLLYVALTRASYGLWLGVAPIGTSKNLQTERSAFGYLLNGTGKFTSVAAHRTAVEQLAQHANAAFSLAPSPIAQQVPSASSNTLESARTAPTLGELSNWWIASYSALQLGPQGETRYSPDTAHEDQLIEQAQAAANDDALSEQIAPDDAVMHHFPRGPKWGTFLHSLLEWAAVAENRAGHRGFAVAAEDDAQRLEYIAKRCSVRNIEEHAEPLSAWLKDFLAMPWHATGFALTDLPPQHIAVELEFLIESHNVRAQELDELVRAYTVQGAAAPQLQENTLNGMFKGFIDLVVEHEGQYYVVDWKSNYLGPNDAAYSQEAMQDAIWAHRYDLQYCLYLLAVHRLLKARLPNYDYDTHIGGAVYVFLRGSQHPSSQGIFHHKPPRELIDAMDRLFTNTNKEAAHA